MKTKTYLTFTVAVGLLLLSGSAFSQEYKNRYVKDYENKRIEEIDHGYRQIQSNAYDDGGVSQNDSHEGHRLTPPYRARIINNLKRETDQPAVLRLSSAPTHLARSGERQEKWIYH
jgi:hypothetical protein